MKQIQKSSYEEWVEIISGESNILSQILEVKQEMIDKGYNPDTLFISLDGWRKLSDYTMDKEYPIHTCDGMILGLLIHIHVDSSILFKLADTKKHVYYIKGNKNELDRP